MNKLDVWKDFLIYAYNDMRRAGWRTLLASLGVFLSSILLFSILTLSESFLTSLNEELSAFGKNVIIVLPYENVEQSFGGLAAGRAPAKGKLTESDVSEIGLLEGVDSVSAVYFFRATISYRDKAFRGLVFGSSPEIFEQYPHFELEKGRVFENRGEAVLGGEVAEELGVQLNSRIFLDGKPFRVVGILKKIGTALSESDDNSIMILEDDAKLLGADDISFISISSPTPRETAAVIEERLLVLHRVSKGDKDFSVVTADEIINKINSVLEIGKSAMVVLSLVALLVGSASIVNTMFAIGEERKRDIAVMRSMGATKRFVLLFFLAEGAFMGVLGGLLGIFFSSIILFFISSYYRIFLNPLNALFTLFSSLFVSLIATYLPAKRAAETEIVEVLRES